MASDLIAISRISLRSMPSRFSTMTFMVASAAENEHLLDGLPPGFEGNIGRGYFIENTNGIYLEPRAVISFAPFATMKTTNRFCRFQGFR